MWVTSLLSSGVAVASVVVNDYFDFASGVDGVNSPDKVGLRHYVATWCSVEWPGKETSFDWRHPAGL